MLKAEPRQTCLPDYAADAAPITKLISPRLHSAVDVVSQGEVGRAWRVAVTREEIGAGPLTRALRAEGLWPVPCPVFREAAPADPQPLRQAAKRLNTYDWLICASARGVEALRSTGVMAAWPAGIRAAAVGTMTARALVEAGVPAPPIVAETSGADALWPTLAGCETWPGRRVLLLTTSGGRTTLADELRRAGAMVDEVEAYRMVARPVPEIKRDWEQNAPDAAVLASPRTARTLIAAVGPEALGQLRAVVAIGETTAEALKAGGLRCHVAPRATFADAARTLARLLPDGMRS